MDGGDGEGAGSGEGEGWVVMRVVTLHVTIFGLEVKHLPFWIFPSS